jgi:hypothetical protein
MIFSLMVCNVFMGGDGCPALTQIVERPGTGMRQIICPKVGNFCFASVAHLEQIVFAPGPSNIRIGLLDESLLFISNCAESALCRNCRLVRYPVE